MAKFEIKPDDPIDMAVLKELWEFFGGDFPEDHVEDDEQLRQLAEEAAIRHMASRPNNESLDSVLGQVWAHFWCNHTGSKPRKRTANGSLSIRIRKCGFAPCVGMRSSIRAKIAKLT